VGWVISRLMSGRIIPGWVISRLMSGRIIPMVLRKE